MIYICIVLAMKLICKDTKMNWKLYLSSGWKLQIENGEYIVFYLFLKFWEKEGHPKFKMVSFEGYDLICFDCLGRNRADELRDFLKTEIQLSNHYA